MKVGNFYRVYTDMGIRTVKAMQEINEGLYGAFSVSDHCKEELDALFMVIPEGSKEANEEQIKAWNAWYHADYEE